MSQSTLILTPVLGEAAATMSESSQIGLVFFGLLFFLCLFLLAGAVLHTWWTSRQAERRLERETELKKHMLDRGLPVDEIERLLRATAEQPKPAAKIDDEDVDALGELGGLLGCCEPDAKPEAIEEVLAIARTADTKMRRAMVSAVTEMRGNTGAITDEQIRAVVRALARPAGPSTLSTTPANDLPPLTGTASRITDAFHLPE